jgi:hypothetical protein
MRIEKFLCLFEAAAPFANHWHIAGKAPTEAEAAPDHPYIWYPISGERWFWHVRVL